MKIVEMIGLPGSGKSFVLNNLLLKDIQIIDENCFYESCRKVNMKKKVFVGIKTMTLYLDVVCLLVLYSLFCSERRAYSFKKVIDFIKYVSLYDCVVKMKRNKDLIAFDQGIIQYIWSINFFNSNGLKENKILKYVFSRIEKKFKIYYFYYKVDYKLAAKRATSRESKCELDCLKFEQLCKLYRNHSNDYKVIFKYLNNSRIFISNNEQELKKNLLYLKGLDEKNE